MKEIIIILLFILLSIISFIAVANIQENRVVIEEIIKTQSNIIETIGTLHND